MHEYFVLILLVTRATQLFYLQKESVLPYCLRRSASLMSTNLPQNRAKPDYFKAHFTDFARKRSNLLVKYCKRESGNEILGIVSLGKSEIDQEREKINNVCNTT